MSQRLDSVKNNCCFVKKTRVYNGKSLTLSDAYSAQQLIKIMLCLTKKGTTIMCTIHQPSSQIFDMFHSVLLLTEGRICFNGRPSEAISFFSR